MASASELREKELVEKVELKFALADSPEKYEQVIDVFLPPLLLKMASPHESVRKQVFNAVKEVISRFSTMTTVKLPVRKLLEGAKNPPKETVQNSSTFVLYSLLLVSKGVDRLDEDEKRNLIPMTIKGISKLSKSAAARVFHIVCKLILNWKQPARGTEEEEVVKKELKLEDESDLDFILKNFTNFFLLTPAKKDPNSNIIPRGYTCPGLSVEDVSFFTYEAGVTFSKDQMLQFKAAIFNFVTGGLVSDDGKLINFLSVASVDNSDLSDRANGLIKKIVIPYEEATFMNFLTSLYIGDKKTGRPPVGYILQEKILHLLNHSIIATQSKEKVSLICSIALHSPEYKLRFACLKFIQHVATYNHECLFPDEQSTSATTNIASLIRNNLHTEGWPRLQFGSAISDIKAAVLQRRLQYETLGSILSKNFDLVSDLSFIEFLLESLRRDKPEFRASIQQSLSCLLPHLPNLPEISKRKLKALLKQTLDENFDLEASNDTEEKDAIMSCRFVAIKYANAAFDFSDVDARILNILGTARTNRFDIIEEAYKGLNPYWYKVNKNTNLIKTEGLKQSSNVRNKEILFPDSESFIKVFLDDYNELQVNDTRVLSHCIGTCVRFVKQTIVSNALVGKDSVVSQDEEWSLKIEKALQIDSEVIHHVGDYFNSLNCSVVAEFMQIVCNEFTVRITSNGEHKSKYRDTTFGETFFSLLKLGGPSILKLLSLKMNDLLQVLSEHSTKTDTEIILSANSLGIIATANSDASEIVDLLRYDTTITLDDATFNRILAVTFVLPRLYLKRSQSPFTELKLIELIDALLIGASTAKYRYFAIRMLSELLKFGIISTLSAENLENINAKILRTLIEKPLREEIAIECIGYLSLYENDFDEMDKILASIIEVHNSDHIDLVLTAGESLSILLGRSNCTVLKKQIDVYECAFECSEDSSSVDGSKILTEILKVCEATKPKLRKAGCLWLLALVEYNKNSSYVKDSCEKLHAHFLKFLGDRDEFVQESVARGLSVVYELAGPDLKDTMIKTQIRLLSDSTGDSKISSETYHQDTELFDSGVLNTGNESVRTYKDILNLASEMGNPALVYKFMSLAKNSALWSTRKGASFGLGAVMTKNSFKKMLKDDQEMTSKLIPKLYIYRFDPNGSVAKSMNDIWTALIYDSSAVIDQYFDSIMSEISKGMVYKEWKTRESSTVGLLKLIQTQQKEKFEPYLLELLKISFRIMDDIKESVRKVGTKLATALSKLSVKYIDDNNKGSSEKSKELLNTLIKFLLSTKGLNSEVEEVRTFSLNTILELMKNSGPKIKDFVPELLYELITLFSSIEPQVMNYVALNAENYKIDPKMIDKQRSMMVSNSPLFSAIKLLIDFSDSSSLESTVTFTMKAIRKSVGLPSKVAASTVLILLVEKFSTDLKPFGGKLLKSCFNAMSDKNDSVKQAFAISFGYVNRIVTNEKAVKYGEQIVEKYFDEEGHSDKLLVSATIESVFKYAPSQFDDIASLFMPLLYVASHDVEKDVRISFNNVLTEVSSTGTGTVKLYFEEILKLTSVHIFSNNFSVRRTCANSVSALCEVVDITNSTPQIMNLFEVTLKALEGRTWEGKEAIFEALVTLSTKSSSFFKSHEEVKESVENSLANEISRKNQDYLKNIINHYMRYSEVYCSEKSLSLIQKSIESTLKNLKENSQKYEDVQSVKRPKIVDDINRKSSKSNLELEEFLIKLYKNAAKLCKKLNNGEYPASFSSFVLRETVSLYQDKLIVFTWRTQVASCVIAMTIIDNYKVDDASLRLEKEMYDFWKNVIKYNSDAKSIEQVKIKTIQLAAAISKCMSSLKADIENDISVMDNTDLTPRIEEELKLLSLSFK